MKSICRSRTTTAMMTTLASTLLLSTTIAFAPAPLPSAHHTHSSNRPSIPSSLQMSLEQEVSDLVSLDLEEVSDFYANFPLQAAILTCGVKASVADGVAQLRTITNPTDLEFKRNLAYILYGGIFIGAMCHYEYDVIFPLAFGSEHSLLTSAKEVLFDNFVSAPLMWLPPAYLVKALVYDYPLKEGLAKYVHDVKTNGLLNKYWTIWVPAQSISFTVVPDQFRIVFMASVSFFWFIILSTLSAEGDSSSSNVKDV